MPNESTCPGPRQHCVFHVHLISVAGRSYGLVEGKASFALFQLTRCLEQCTLRSIQGCPAAKLERKSENVKEIQGSRWHIDCRNLAVVRCDACVRWRLFGDYLLRQPRARFEQQHRDRERVLREAYAQLNRHNLVVHGGFAQQCVQRLRRDLGGSDQRADELCRSQLLWYRVND